jgi:hypothetical protein
VFNYSFSIHVILLWTHVPPLLSSSRWSAVSSVSNAHRDSGLMSLHCCLLLDGARSAVSLSNAHRLWTHVPPLFSSRWRAVSSVSNAHRDSGLMSLHCCLLLDGARSAVSAMPTETDDDMTQRNSTADTRQTTDILDL